MSLLDKVKDIGSDLLHAVDKSNEEKNTTSSEGGRTYIVKSGDTLSAIAKQFYNDPAKYMSIFEANKDKLTSPDEIVPGQVLQLPE